MSKLQHLVKSDLLWLTYLDDFIGFHYNYKNIYLRKYNDGELWNLLIVGAAFCTTNDGDYGKIS